MMIIAAKEFWLNSHFSVARFTGGIRYDNHNYLVIPPADDLVRDDFIKHYKKMGRVQFINFIESKPGAKPEELLKELKQLEKTSKEKNLTDAQLKLEL